MESHDTWYVVDSSKIEAYMACPRQFFYRYICGWVTDTENIDFVFGRAWHAAQEQLLLTGYNLESVAMASALAEAIYRDAFPIAETDVERLPKVPAAIDSALLVYTNRYKGDKAVTLHTEIAGTVPITTDGPCLHFKMDSILQDERGYFSREHKTGSANSRQWKDSFRMKFQISTYLHVLYCSYPLEQVWGVEVGGAVFTKSKGVEFERIPVRKHPRMMEVWLKQANYYYKEIMHDMQLLQEEDHSGKDVMDCFQLNTTNCTAYRGCPYMDFCLSWANPLQYDLTKPPGGFKVEFWDPRLARETAKKVIDL